MIRWVPSTVTAMTSTGAEDRARQLRSASPDYPRDPDHLAGAQQQLDPQDVAHRRHARQPALPRMSDEWLRTYYAESGHRNEFWRDRW